MIWLGLHTHYLHHTAVEVCLLLLSCRWRTYYWLLHNSVTMDEDESLPAGWTRYFDETHRVPYYYHDESGTSAWENPTSSAYTVPNEKTPPPPLEDKDDDKGGTLCDDDFPYSIPIFDIPEDRLWDMYEHDRKEEMDEEEHEIKQDYVNMARQYKTLRLYLDSKVIQSCVLCSKEQATHVLFPCEHRCLCNGCIIKEEICADNKMSSNLHGHCNCPLCATIIKKILPFEGGAEVETYWLWVYEMPPPLSDKFFKRWKHSAAVIDKVYIQKEENEGNEGRRFSKSCAVM